MSFVNTTFLLSIPRPATHSKKVGTGKAFYHFVILPFLFHNTLKRRLGTRRHQVIKCFKCNFVPFFLQTSYKVGNSTGLRCRILRFQNAPTHSLLETGRDCSRPVKYPYPLPPQPGLCNVCRMWFCIVLLKYAWWRPWKRCLLEAQHMCSQNLYVLFSIMVPSQKCTVTFAKGTDTTPYHDRPWLLDLLLVTVWMILFFFGPEHTASIPPKNYLKYWFIWPQYTFPLCDGPSQMPPSPRSRRRFWTLLT